MKITGLHLSAMAIDDAVSTVNAGYGYPTTDGYDGNADVRPGIAEKDKRDGCTEVSFRLRVIDSRKRGASVTGIGTGHEKHSINACWHLHRDVMAVLLTAHPDAVNRTGMLVNNIPVKYAGAADFLARYPVSAHVNVGSQVHPVTASEACDCHTHNYGSMFVTELKTMVEDMAKASANRS